MDMESLMALTNGAGAAAPAVAAPDDGSPSGTATASNPAPTAVKSAAINGGLAALAIIGLAMLLGHIK